MLVLWRVTFGCHQGPSWDHGGGYCIVFEIIWLVDRRHRPFDGRIRDLGRFEQDFFSVHIGGTLILIPTPSNPLMRVHDGSNTVTCMSANACYANLHVKFLESP